MDAKINQKHQKCRKRGMPKMMPKFDAEKKFKSEILDAILDPSGSRRGSQNHPFWHKILKKVKKWRPKSETRTNVEI